MKTDKILQTLSLSEKVHQMFILGLSGTCLSDENLNIQKAVRMGIGGIILFTPNIESYEQTAQLSADLQKLATIPLFVSIDQEGGRVERTHNVKNKVNYLPPGEIAATKTPEFAARQAEIMVKELQSMGVNMDFAPVLDVNTNPKNPIIGIRSFGDTPEQVIKFAKPVYQTFMANNIVPVVKHFPGHGMTGEDSHLTMPSVDLSMEELERIHIAPFKRAIADGVSAIMVSHVHYKAFNEDVTPASLSENVIKQNLRDKLGFEGIVVSDDMVMGGVKNYYDSLTACIKGINAGINLFIFRDSTDEVMDLINQIVFAVEKGDIPLQAINYSAKQILACKEKFIEGIA